MNVIALTTKFAESVVNFSNYMYKFLDLPLTAKNKRVLKFPK